MIVIHIYDFTNILVCANVCSIFIAFATTTEIVVVAKEEE